MPTKKNFSTIYLQGQGISSSGAKLAAKDTLDADKVRKEMAAQIYDRLVNAYAMIEVAKECEVFTEEYAEDLINKAKDTDNNFDTKKEIKSAIYKEIYKAMSKAEKEFKYYSPAKENKPTFE